jgi:hypothetical protein
MNKNQSGKKRKDRHVRISLPTDDESSNLLGSVTLGDGGGRFQSVLDRPFNKWNEMEDVLAIFVPGWNHTERGCLLQHLVHFLELKVVMEEHIPGHLLAPTKLVNKAWQALVLESRLYKRVTFTIQSFHGRPRSQIHYSLLADMEGATYESQLRRTQSLFQCYYGQYMPISLDDVESDCSAMDDASALTDALAGWGLNQRCAGANLSCVDSPRKRVHLEASSISENPFRNNKTEFSPSEACVMACQATMFCADEYLTYGLDKEDYESCVTPDGEESEGVEVIECPPTKKFST